MLKWLLSEFRIPNLPGKSLASIEQELAAILLAHSVLRTSMLLAAAEHGCDPTRLSLSGVQGVLGRYLLRLPHLSPRKLPVWLDRMLSEIARHKLPAPAQRLCPRAVKVKMSKWPTKSRSKSPPSAPSRRRYEFRSTSTVFASSHGIESKLDQERMAHLGPAVAANLGHRTNVLYRSRVIDGRGFRQESSSRRYL